jgi:hypothetical protein
MGIRASRSEQRASEVATLRSSDQMDNLHVKQVLGPPLRYEAPVTVIGGGLSAEETWALIACKELAADGPSVTFGEQGEELPLVEGPVTPCLVGSQDFWRGRQFGMMLVSDGKALSEQELEIVPLGKASQLRSVSQPDVNDGIHAGLLEEADELFKGFPGKADGIDG